MMAEFQLESLSAKGKPAKLMPEANPKNRYFSDELLDIFDRIADWLGIARSVRKKKAVGLQAQGLIGRSAGRHDPHFAVMIDEQPQNVLFDAVIESHHAMPVVFRLLAGFAHLLRPRRNGNFD